MKNYFKGLDKEQKPLVLLSFLLAMMAFFLVPFLFSSNSFAQNAPISAGYSSVESVSIDEWDGNVKVMQRVADQLGVSYQESSQQELSKALLKVDSAKLAQVKELNLSGLGITRLPHAMKYFTGLESLDVSNNQLTTIPDFLLEKENLTIKADFNILPEEYGYPCQYHLFVLNVESENFHTMSLTDQYDPSFLTDVAKNSIWFEADLESGGVSVAEPSNDFAFQIVPDSLQSVEGLPLSHYVDVNTGVIYREGKLTGKFYLTDSLNSFYGSEILFTVQLISTDPSLVDVSIWKGKEALQADVLAQTGINSIGDLPTRQLSTLTSLTVSSKGFQQLPEMIQYFPQVKKIILHEATDVSSLNGISQIEELSIVDANLTELPTGIVENTFLKTIELSGNPLPSSILGSFSQMNTLENLIFDRCGFLEIPEEIVFPEHLKSISLQSNQLTVFPKIFINSSIPMINLSFNQISILPGEVQSIVKEGSIVVDGNLLDTNYANQRQLIFREGTSKNFSVEGAFEPTQILSDPNLLTLSDGSAISQNLSLVFRQKNGLPLPGSRYISEGGIVLVDGTVDVNLQVYGTENNTNAVVSITLILKTTNEALANYQQELSEKLGLLPENMQSIITEINNSTIESVNYTSQEPDNVDAFLFRTLQNSEKTFSYVVNETNNLSYKWTFKYDQINEALPLNTGIEEGSLFDAEIQALAGSTALKTLTFENHGELPGNALISVTFPVEENVQQNQYLYHFNEETSTLEYVGLVYFSGNEATFAINHTSVYVISPEILTSAVGNPKTPSNVGVATEQIALFFSIGILLFVGIFGIGRSVSLMGPTANRPTNREFDSYLFASKEEKNDLQVKNDKDSPAENEKKEVAHKEQLLQNEMYTLPRYMSSSTTTSLPQSEVLEGIENIGIDFSRYFSDQKQIPNAMNINRKE